MEMALVMMMMMSATIEHGIDPNMAPVARRPVVCG